MFEFALCGDPSFFHSTLFRGLFSVFCFVEMDVFRQA